MCRKRVACSLQQLCNSLIINIRQPRRRHRSRNKRRALKTSELGGKPRKQKGLPPNFVNGGLFIPTRKIENVVLYFDNQYLTTSLFNKVRHTLFYIKYIYMSRSSFGIIAAIVYHCLFKLSCEEKMVYSFSIDCDHIFLTCQTLFFDHLVYYCILLII